MAKRHQDALTVQNACNLSGVAHALLRACQEVRAEGGGTDAINADPAVRLFVNKLAALTNQAEFDASLAAFGDCYEACARLAEQPLPADPSAGCTAGPMAVSR